MDSKQLAAVKVGDVLGVARYSTWSVLVHRETVKKITATQIVTEVDPQVSVFKPIEPKRFNRATGKQITSGHGRYELWSLERLQAHEARKEAEHASHVQVLNLDNVDWRAFTDEQRAKVLKLVDSFSKNHDLAGTIKGSSRNEALTRSRLSGGADE